MSWSDDARCLYCGAKLPLHRKVLSEQFCSDAHQRSFRIEQDQLALERLTENHQQLNPQLAAELAALEAHESRPGDESGLGALAQQVDDPNLAAQIPAEDDRRLAHEYPARTQSQSLHYEWLAQETADREASRPEPSNSQLTYDPQPLATRPFAANFDHSGGSSAASNPVPPPISAMESAIALTRGTIALETAAEAKPLVASPEIDVPSHLAMLGQAQEQPQEYEALPEDYARYNDAGNNNAAYDDTNHAGKHGKQVAVDEVEENYDGHYEPELGPYFVETLEMADGPVYAVALPWSEPIESFGYELAVPDTLAALTVASDAGLYPVGLYPGLISQAADFAGGSSGETNPFALAAYLPEPSHAADSRVLLALDSTAEFSDLAIVMPLFVGKAERPGIKQGEDAGSLPRHSSYLMATAGNHSPGSAAAGNRVIRNTVAPCASLTQSLALPRLITSGQETRPEARVLAGENRLLSLRVRLSAQDAAGAPKRGWIGAQGTAEFSAASPILPASKLEAVWRGNDRRSDQGRVQNAFTFWSGGTPDQAGGKHALALASDFWHNAPREFKMLAVAIPLLLALVFHPGLPKISFGAHSAAPASASAKSSGSAKVLAQAPATAAMDFESSTPATGSSARFVAAKTAANTNATGRATNVDFPVNAGGNSALAKDGKLAEIGFAANLKDHFAVFQESLAQRAGVELNDDFRSGMDAWQSRGDLAAGWSFDSNGFVRPGTVALYHPSLALRDYDMEFLGLIDKKALSWMVRAQDFDNYYAVKLVIIRAEPLPVLGVRRYAVINGKPQKAVQIEFPNPTRADSLYRVGMNIHDDTFLLTLQGKVVDTWSEPRLKRGGIGFFSSPGEESRLRWVHVSHQYDMLGRICAFLAPYNSAQ